MLFVSYRNIIIYPGIHLNMIHFQGDSFFEMLFRFSFPFHRQADTLLSVKGCTHKCINS